MPSRNGVEEKVILCTTVWTAKPRTREAYTISEFEWMVVKVNALWRRKHKTFNMKSKRIHFFCRICNKNMVDKSELAWHRQQDLCLMYDSKKDGPLKMFPINGTKGNSEIATVFKKYNMKLPWQNGGKVWERPKGELSVESVDNEDVVTLSSDASSDASLLEPLIKNRKVEKSIREELMDRKPRLDKRTQDVMVFKRKGNDKGKDKDKEKNKEKNKEKSKEKFTLTTPPTKPPQDEVRIS